MLGLCMLKGSKEGEVVGLCMMKGSEASVATALYFLECSWDWEWGRSIFLFLEQVSSSRFKKIDVVWGVLLVDGGGTVRTMHDASMRLMAENRSKSAVTLCEKCEPIFSCTWPFVVLCNGLRHNLDTISWRVIHYLGTFKATKACVYVSISKVA